MRKAGLIGALAMAALAGTRGQASEPAKTIQQLMAEDVRPTAEIYWNAVRFITDESGDHDIAPETDAEWKTTRDAATRIGELGALLQASAYGGGRGKDWAEFARSLAEVSKLAEQAVDERDPDKVFEVGATIYSVCSSCHRAYPPATARGGARRPL